MAGFGGVAEYGITVRWNKNYLKLVRLLLERRREVRAFRRHPLRRRRDAVDGRCLGDGLRPHRAVHGRRQADGARHPERAGARRARRRRDFLMALQLTGAAKLSSIANLQLRLPVVVIGGGLTAIDTATESLAYYVRQVEKFAARYRTLVAERGEAAVRAAWNAEEAGIADEFLAHAAAIDAERDAGRGARAGPPRLAQLLEFLGRRDHRLSPPADRQPVLHAEPRGSGQGAGGGGPLRRRPDAAGGGGRPTSATPPACACHRADGIGDRAAGARHPRRRRHAAQHRAGARGRPHPARRPVFPGGGRDGRAGHRGARPRQARRDACADAPRRQRPLHQLLRRPASELLRQRREGDGRRQARLSRRLARRWPRRTPPASPAPT